MAGSPGTTKVTIVDVAARCGVSITTVSKALSIKPGACDVSAATRARVLVAARELGYAPDWRTRRLASRRSRTIGLVYARTLPHTTSIYHEMAAECATAVTLHGYRLVMVPAPGSVDQWRQVMQQFRLDGCLAVEPLPPDIDRWVPEDSLPVVVINADGGPRLAQVLADDAKGTALAVDHLVGLGHRHLLYLGPGEGCHPSIAARAAGFAAACRARGITGRAVVLAGHDVQISEDQVRAELAQGPAKGSAKESAKSQAKEPASGIVAYNHYLARVALRACVAHGLHVPADISLISCDDVGALTYAIPALTAVRVPVHEMAEAACDLLLACIEGRQKPQASRSVLTGALVVRESTAPPARRLRARRATR